MSMSVASGESCVVNLSTGLNTILYGVTVTTNPAHGTATTEDRYKVLYTSKKDFKGRDEFVFHVIGQMGRSPGTASMRVSVQVQ